VPLTRQIVPLPKTKDGFTVTNPNVVLSLSEGKDGLYISGIHRRRQPSENLLPSESELKFLWKLHLRNSIGRSKSITSEGIHPTSQIETSPDGSKILHLGWEKVRSLDIVVKATIRVKPDEPLIAMRISVDNLSIYSLAQIDFPVILGIGPLSDNPEEDKLIWPRMTGQLVPNPYENHIAYDAGYHYPSMTQAIQVTGVYGNRGGLYLAAHDPDCWAKRLKVYGSIDGTSLNFYLEDYPENIGSGGNDYDMHYDAVIGTFNGDWWEAAQLYRDWALKQRWCRPTTVLEDRNFSETMKETVLWLVLNRKPAVVEEEALAMKSYFGVKCSMQRRGTPLPRNISRRRRVSKTWSPISRKLVWR